MAGVWPEINALGRRSVTDQAHVGDFIAFARIPAHKTRRSRTIRNMEETAKAGPALHACHAEVTVSLQSIASEAHSQ